MASTALIFSLSMLDPLNAQTTSPVEAIEGFLDRSGDMRICQKGESPIIIVEGARVQVCRRQTWDDVENFMRLIQELTPPQQDQETVASRRLCSALIERQDYSAAMEHCIKGSKGGDSLSSLAVANLAERAGNTEIALEFYSLASDQGSEAASLIAGKKHANNSNWEQATLHLRRCYQPSVNGNSYNPKPYSPSSQTKFECTNLALKLILEGKFPQEPFYAQTAVVPASMDSEIPFSEFLRFAAGYRSLPSNWDVYKDEEHLDIRRIKGSALINYRIWMAKDVPVLCHLTYSDGVPVEGVLGKRICRFFQVNFTYHSALSKEGKPISSVLEGSIKYDFPRLR